MQRMEASLIAAHETDKAAGGGTIWCPPPKELLKGKKKTTKAFLHLYCNVQHICL
jgi:hypothetical protein